MGKRKGPMESSSKEENELPPSSLDQEEEEEEEEVEKGEEDSNKEGDHASSDDEEEEEANEVEEEEEDDDDNDDDEANESDRKKSKKVFKLSMKQTKNFNETLRKRGVIYVARVPPRMNPTKLKSLMSEFGQVTRIYLVEEDTTARKRRRKNGGSGSKRYMEGWVEFEKKKVAKHVAINLNNTPISMHKRNVHYGDLWNLKYLKKFQWAHLTEKVAYERRVREQKLRVEMMQARKENAAYQELVETGKTLDKIEERKRKRGETFVSTFRERKTKQKKPMQEGTDKSTKKALLGSLM